MKPSRELQIEQLGEVTLVRFKLPSLIETEQTEEVGRQLSELLGLGRRKLVIDFRDVDRVSSGLVAKIIGVHRRLEALGGRLALCHLAPDIHEVFTMLRLPQFLNIHERDVDAVRSFETTK